MIPGQDKADQSATQSLVACNRRRNTVCHGVAQNRTHSFKEFRVLEEVVCRYGMAGESQHHTIVKGITIV